MHQVMGTVICIPSILIAFPYKKFQNYEFTVT